MNARARLRDEAASWVVRLSAEDADEASYEAFRAWLDTSPEARSAYDAALQVWLEPRPGAAAPEAARSPVRHRLRSGRGGVRVAAALAAVVVATAGTLAWLAGGGASSRVLHTARGERRAFALADGAQVTLGGDSLVTVRSGRQGRTAIMSHGDAVFRVASSAVRPFEVVAGDDALRVAGTEFGVHRRDGRLRVVVRQGLVAVGPARGEVGPRVRLPAGSELNHREGTQTFQVGPVDPDTAFAW